MKFYSATKFIFPRNCEWRVLCLCFIAIHIPFVSAIIFQAISGTWDGKTVLVLLAATWLAATFCLAAIHALVAPLRQAITLLRTVQDGKYPEAIPLADGDDLLGDLLEGVRTAQEETARHLYSIEAVSEYDPLTGIRNRRGFTNAALKVLRGNSNAVIALIDLDHFKLINDRFGHEAGDILLRNIAQTFEANLRRSDLCCRWGGEEFAILFPDTLLDEARMVMERLRASIALDSNLLDESWPITLSCGLAPLRAYEELPEAARRADSALCEAKESGRNRVRVARP